MTRCSKSVSGKSCFNLLLKNIVASSFGAAFAEMRVAAVFYPLKSRAIASCVYIYPIKLMIVGDF
jgi:hypothetical protein